MNNKKIYLNFFFFFYLYLKLFIYKIFFKKNFKKIKKIKIILIE